MLIIVDAEPHELDALIDRLASRLAENLRPVIKQELAHMSAEMDALIVTAHETLDTEDAAAAALQALSVQIANTSGDPAKATALAAELSAKRDTLAAAILNTNPAAPVPTP